MLHQISLAAKNLALRVSPFRHHSDLVAPRGSPGMSSLSSVALRCGVRSVHTHSFGSRQRSTRVVAGWREDSPLAPPDAQSKKKKSKRNRRKEGAKPRVEGGGKGEVDGAELNVIDLGQGKSVSLYVPTNVAEVEGAVSAGGVQD